METVFKEGMLYLKGNKFGKKTWRKMWMVLYPPSVFGIGRAELYDLLDGGHSTTSNTSKSKSSQCRKVVQLSDCLSVTLAPEESCPPALPNDGIVLCHHYLLVAQLVCLHSQNNLVYCEY
uniref:PH domain-containing protein n=2 Tax=Hucho hucho TaxID=62062 RepID=A0A4W5LEQ0_9TELE